MPLEVKSNPPAEASKVDDGPLHVYNFGSAFLKEERGFLAWNRQQQMGQYRMPIGEFVDNVVEETGRTPNRALADVRKWNGVLWDIRGGKVQMKKPAALRRTAYRRTGVGKHSGHVVPGDIQRRPLTERRAWLAIPAISAGREEPTAKAYTMKALGVSRATVTRYRGTLRREGAITQEKLYFRIPPPCPGRPRRRCDFRNARGWWRRTADYVLETVAVRFEPHKNSHYVPYEEPLLGRNPGAEFRSGKTFERLGRILAFYELLLEEHGSTQFLYLGFNDHKCVEDYLGPSRVASVFDPETGAPSWALFPLVQAEANRLKGVLAR